MSGVLVIRGVLNSRVLADRSAKLKRIDVRVFQRKTQAKRLAGKLVQFAARFPRHHPVQVIAEDFVAIAECEAGNWLAAGVLQFDANAARRGSGEVEHQVVAREDQRLRNDLAAFQRRSQRHESVDPQRITAQTSGCLPLVLADVERQFRRRQRIVGSRSISPQF